MTSRTSGHTPSPGLSIAVDPRPGQPCALRDSSGPPAVAHHRELRRIGLNAPVRSLKMLELQITAQATEVYLALRPPAGVPVSFDALPARRDGEPTHVSTPALLRELIVMAHDAGLKVHFCADAPIVTTDDEAAYLMHVACGAAAGADTVVVGCLPACAWLAGRTSVALVAGAAMGVSTPRYAAHLRDTYEVHRVVLPHTLTLREVAMFCELDGLEIETPVQTGAGLDCIRCRLPDAPGIGLGCRAGYTGAHGNGTDQDLGGFLDGASDCALCDVPILLDLGVDAFQIPGRESPNLRQNAKVTQMYRRAINGHAAGTPITEVIEDIDRVELMWQMGWVPRLCDQQRCRFRDTPQQRAYV